MCLFFPFKPLYRNYASIVGQRPLSRVRCVYAAPIKEPFISTKQIINTFLWRCGGGGLALEKNWPKMNIFFINTFNDSEWLLAKALMPSEALRADCLSGEVPWAEPFVLRNFQFESQWCGRCRPFQVQRVKACFASCLKPVLETHFCWMNEHQPLFQTVNFCLSRRGKNMRRNLHKICRAVFQLC